MKDLYVVLIGGLGNQLFQYAAAMSIAEKTGRRIKVVHFNYRHDRKRFYHLNSLARIPLEAGPVISAVIFLAWFLLRIFKARIARNILFLESSYEFDNRITNLSPFALIGYFQSYKYFVDNWASIKHNFIFAPNNDEKFTKISDEIEQADSVAVHVRRGDYVSEQKSLQFHGICGTEYYDKAMQTLNALHKGKKLRYFVFSDEPDVVKEEFLDMEDVTYVDAGFHGWQSYLELVLMSKCKHQIIANSSFSWWAAWINDYSGKTVIAPRHWLANEAISSNDLIPPEWIRL